MAFAAPDPKRVKGDKDRIQRERKAAIKREREAATMRREVAVCYKDHTPKQIALANKMLRCNPALDNKRQIGMSRGKPLYCFTVVS